MSEISNKISSEYEKLTPSQKKAASYILEDGSAIAFESLDSLALRIGVSTTSIIRLARMLGYSGYSDMRQSIRDELNHKNSSLTGRLTRSGKHSDHTKLLENSLSKHIDIIKKTYEAQTEADLTAAIKSIASARSVFVIGLSDSFSLAYNMSIRLGQIRKAVYLMQSVGGIFPMELLGAGEGDVCVAYLLPRYSKTTADILTVMRKNHVTVILFTGQNQNPVRQYGDILLPCDISGFSVKDSIVGPLCLSNYIADAIAIENYESSMEVLSKTEQILSFGHYLNL